MIKSSSFPPRPHRPWIHRDFIKEKLRVRERYWHSITDASLMPLLSTTTITTTSSSSNIIVIPDHNSWRKYLPLLTLLIMDYNNCNCQLILCESVVELMDYRSMSPCIEIPIIGRKKEEQQVVGCDGDDKTNDDVIVVVESPAPQERSKIQRLLQNQKIIPFCDLSVRDDIEEEVDEFDMMNYTTMNINERSNHALLRAGGMILQQQQQQQQSAASASAVTPNEIYILSSDDETFRSQFPNSEEGIHIISIDSLLNILFSSNEHMNNNDIMEADTVKELQNRCEKEYRLRNYVSKANNTNNNVDISKEHLTETEIMVGLKNKTLLKGRIDVTKDNPREGFVSVSSSTGGETYFIDNNRGHFNRSIHYDTVIIQPLPESDWGRPMGKRRLIFHRDDDDNNNNNNNNTISEGGGKIDTSTTTTTTVPSACVVAIVESTRRQYVATMVDTPLRDENVCLVVPMDIRIPKIRIKTNSWRNFIGRRLFVQIDTWEVGSNYPSGHVISILGDVADLETEITCLLKENQLDLEPFSAASLACLPMEGDQWKIPQDEISSRLDLRSTHRIFSVDPPGCQDIDDTMHAKVLPNGDLEIGVHIADVTHFLRQGSPLDLQAQARGTTFYLVDRRFDMLPSLLSSDLCSLHGGTDRLAVSVVWVMSRDFSEIKSFWYGRTVIHNCQAMTYNQAHNIIHGNPPEDENYDPPPPLTAGERVNPARIKDLKHDLTILTELARKLRKDREEKGGAVDLSSGDQGSELKFTLDENKNPVKVTPKKQEEIHSTIAELMILANAWVAKTIYQKFPNTALLRSHRSVDEDRFSDLKEALQAGKISFDGSTNMALAKSLKNAESKSKSLMSLFQSLATRAMSEALYVCTGKVQEAGLSHYGLGIAKYTHFTSPIRRYADVVVHRQLLHTAKITSRARMPIQRLELSDVPSSNVISIESGEGLVDASVDASLQPTRDSIEGIPGLVDSAENFNDMQNQQLQQVYECNEVVKLCDGINRQNRMAKFSSFECQNLFLSLYFKEKSEITQAIVMSLRSNGFFAYVPRFDFRGPVFLTDRSGVLQMDPALLGLDPSAGQEATGGFSSSEFARKLISGRCNLVLYPDEHLEITVPEKESPYSINVLDVVTVKICCNDWDARARVPQPRLHLIGDSAPSFGNKNANRGRPIPQQRGALGEEAVMSPKAESTTMRLFSTSMAIDSDMLGLLTPPVLKNEPLRTKAASKKMEIRGVQSMAGRVVFGEFKNPDTHTAKQEASISEASEAAKYRRNQAAATNQKNNEFNTTTRIEKDATARIQRLAAGKRNARKGKAK